MRCQLELPSPSKMPARCQTRELGKHHRRSLSRGPRTAHARRHYRESHNRAAAHRTACRCCRVYVNGQALEIDICTRMQAHPLPYSSVPRVQHTGGARATPRRPTDRTPPHSAEARASAHENTHSHRDTAAQDTGWLLRSPTRCRLLARTAALKGRMARRARWGLPNNASSLAVLSSTRTRLSW